jgi:hypothetical protein
MKISEVKSDFKVADIVLDKDHKVRKIKFIFLDKIKDKNNKPIDKGILKDNSGRIYFFVSNKKIMKIGKSKCKGGIKNTMNFYQGGMQGGPSIRTFGIHILLKEELESGKRVEVYMMICKKSKMFVEGLFGEEKIYVTPDVLDVEFKCKNDYKEKIGKYPPWNFQENGVSWRKDILRMHGQHNSGRKVFFNK